MKQVRRRRPRGGTATSDHARIFNETRTIAVVGLSPDPTRDSYRVARYLKEQGYEIIPVNPTVSEVLSARSYPDIRSIPGPVDMVDVFRRSEALPGIVEDAVAKGGVKTLWTQYGVVHDGAARRAREVGLVVVEDRCAKVEHRRLVRDGAVRPRALRDQP